MNPLMRNMVSRITSAMERDASLDDLKNIYTRLEQRREEVIESFVGYKRRNGRDERNFNFNASQVTGLKWNLHEPDGEDKIDWLHHAKGMALRIEQFHSHTMHKNPNPEWKAGRHAYAGDTRAPRSKEEQAWLIAEDRYTKLSHKIHHKKKNLKRRKTHKKRGKHATPHAGEMPKVLLKRPVYTETRTQPLPRFPRFPVD